jgi:hypothetical protein
MKKIMQRRNQFGSILLLVLAIMSLTKSAFGQEEEKRKARPVRSPFESTMLLEKQTTETNSEKTLQMVMQHRFGNVTNEGFDLFGIYGASNIRIGLNYSILKNVQIGIGTSKFKLIQDLNWKWSILEQTRSNSIPLAITYYGNVAMEALGKENYQKFSHRVSYFHDLLISRKFSHKFTLQLSFSYAHFNVVDSSSFSPQGDTVVLTHDRRHDNFGIGLIGRYKVSPQSSILFEYDQPINLTEVDVSKPNLSLGFEVSTGSHAFQIIIGSYKAILPQRNLVYNDNDFTKGDVFLGFNITRLWNF